MKKSLVVLIALTLSASVFAQDYNQAIGLRFGYDFALAYKDNVSSANFYEIGVNLHPWGNALGVNAYGFYNWNHAFSGARGLSWYVGPGATIGLYNDGFAASINCMIGLEYKFAGAPIALSLDYAPGLGFYNNNDLNGFGFCGYIGGLGVKYTF